MQKIKFLCLGETGLVVELGDQIDPDVNARVHFLTRRIKEEMSRLVDAVVPTYRSLLIIFDPLLVDRRQLIESIQKMANENLLPLKDDNQAKIVIIPTLYGGPAGLDILFVAEHNRLTVEEVIQIHSSATYRIYMMGFTPGFPYLGGMSEKIATPRLKEPRTRIPAGSVGIAGAQTGLYPVESPGGWQLIGRTPLKVFDPFSSSPFLYSAGDFLKFEPIGAAEYSRIEAEIASGQYVPCIHPVREANR